MPKGPQGQKRPADVIGNAVHVMRIATGINRGSRSTSPREPFLSVNLPSSDAPFRRRRSY
jgi:hypothetical protein